MSLRISIVDGAKVRTKVMDKWGVKLHIHDTCGSFYMNLDEPNDEIKEFVVNEFKAMGQEVEVSTLKDGMYFSFD